MLSQTSKVVVEFKDVCVQYPGKVHALKDINMRIFEGEFAGLIGPNGAGKSTLLSVILGLITPTTGSVKLFGEPFSTNNLRKVGYVPQQAQAADPNFPSTVFETVLMGRTPQAGLLHRLGKKDNQKVMEVLRLLEIEDLKDRKVGQLSGGQSQRVFLAKALVGEPSLLLLDEPTSGVDVHYKSAFYDLLAQLNRDMRITVVLSSHDISVVTKFADKVVCINTSLFFCGETAEFASSSVLSKVYNYPFGLIQHHDHP